MNVMLWMVSQINIVEKERPKCRRFNPRPIGIIVPGSSSDIVLNYFRSSDSPKARCDIIKDTRLSGHAVEWALIYLQRNNIICRERDFERNRRYGKYRLIRSDDHVKVKDDAVL